MWHIMARRNYRPHWSSNTNLPPAKIENYFNKISEAMKSNSLLQRAYATVAIETHISLTLLQSWNYQIYHFITRNTSKKKSQAKVVGVVIYLASLMNGILDLWPESLRNYSSLLRSLIKGVIFKYNILSNHHFKLFRKENHSGKCFNFMVFAKSGLSWSQ